MQHRLLAALAFTLLALPAQAQLARSFSSATYTGVGASRMSTDFDNLKEAFNLDAVGGYNITPALPWGRITAELNLSVTVAPGKNEGQPQTTTTPGGVLGGGGSTTTQSGTFTQSNDDLQAFVLNLQAIYRTPGRLYAMGSLGYALTNTSIQEIEDNGRSHFTFGAGGGFKFGEETAAVELLFTRVSEDLQTIGIRFIY
jgi:hypothetical protein